MERRNSDLIQFLLCSSLWTDLNFLVAMEKRSNLNNKLVEWVKYRLHNSNNLDELEIDNYPQRANNRASENPLRGATTSSVSILIA